MDALWIHIWGGITVIACMIGIYLGMHRILRFHSDDSIMANRLVHVVFTDISIYGITAFFGLATLVGVDLDGWLYPARAMIFITNIYFSYRLVKPF